MCLVTVHEFLAETYPGLGTTDPSSSKLAGIAQSTEELDVKSQIATTLLMPPSKAPQPPLSHPGPSAGHRRAQAHGVVLELQKAERLSGQRR